MLVRLTREGPDKLVAPFAGADGLIAQRRAEADEFYDAITPPAVTDDAKAVMRQALAGMLWSKQCYYFDVDVGYGSATSTRCGRRRGGGPVTSHGST